MALFGGHKTVGPNGSQVTGNVFLKGTPGSQHFPVSLGLLVTKRWTGLFFTPLPWYTIPTQIQSARPSKCAPKPEARTNIFYLRCSSQVSCLGDEGRLKEPATRCSMGKRQIRESQRGAGSAKVSKLYPTSHTERTSGEAKPSDVLSVDSGTEIYSKLHA